MNSLSWFLYGADVFNGIGTFLGVVSMLLMLAMVIFSVLAVGYGIVGEKFPQKLNWLWVPVIFLCIFSVLIPSKNTMYAIAASELGEKAYSSEIGQKVTRAIEAWIDLQLPKGDKK